MPNAGRRVCVVIGVASAPPLAFVGGARNGARSFANWARAMGYETHLVTDETTDVTMQVLKSEIISALQPLDSPIYRLVLYFAGHGLIREAEEGLWLLSDWYSELRAVAQEALKRRLFAYNIRQIAIFADACRDLPNNIHTADLAPDPVLGRGPNSTLVSPPVDKFIAAQDGTSAYMIPGARAEEDVCIFSGVLMEGLWAVKEAAISRLEPGKVTSSSLGNFLRTEVPQAAMRYQRTLNPAVYPLLPDGDNIYFDRSANLPIPVLAPWPALSAVTSSQSLGAASAESSPVVRIKVEASSQSSAAAQIRTYERLGPKALFDGIHHQLTRARQHGGPGLFVEGVPVRAIQGTHGIIARSDGDPNSWSITYPNETGGPKPSPLLIEFEDGLAAAIVGLPYFAAAVLRDESGVAALVYDLVGSRPSDYEAAVQAIVAMENGSLRADAATDLAVKLRKEKHRDPVLGVISAYLYDAIGDVENIRRMAGYYVQQNQPIPYDIALLALVRGYKNDGRLWVHLPAVEKSSPRTRAEAEHSWTCSEMPDMEGLVAGHWPWMRQGWAYIEKPDQIEVPLIEQNLAGIAQHIARSRFTTLDAEGAKQLIQIFGLERCDAYT